MSEMPVRATPYYGEASQSAVARGAGAGDAARSRRAPTSVAIEPVRPGVLPPCEYRRRVSAVAALHAGTITEGFLSRLGVRFLRQVYFGLAEDHASRLWLAQAGGDVLGFLAYCPSVQEMYRRVLQRRCVRLAAAAFPAALRPSVLREILDTLRYPAKQADHGLPEAEILSVGVSAQARGMGIGQRLVEHACAAARMDGQRELKVLAGDRLEGANRFYFACGFEHRCQIVQHGELLNVYVMKLAAGD